MRDYRKSPKEKEEKQKKLKLLLKKKGKKQRQLKMRELDKKKKLKLLLLPRLLESLRRRELHRRMLLNKLELLPKRKPPPKLLD